MIVIMSYSHKDYNLAFYAAEMLLRKTEFPGDKFLLYGSEAAPKPPMDLGIPYIKSEKDSNKYPAGPNLMFSGLMSLAEKKFNDPLFLCEPDGFPTCTDWYERVKEAHSATGKHVSGSLVSWVDPPHLNGNLVIEPAIIRRYPWLKRPVVQAWDCFHAEILLDEGADNAEILNAYRGMLSYPTEWWFGHEKNGRTPAWIHGCQSYQAWEHIARTWDEVG